MVTSRKREDLDAFCEAIVEQMADGMHAHEAA